MSLPKIRPVQDTWMFFSIGMSSSSAPTKTLMSSAAQLKHQIFEWKTSQKLIGLKEYCYVGFFYSNIACETWGEFCQQQKHSPKPPISCDQTGSWTQSGEAHYPSWMAKKTKPVQCRHLVFPLHKTVQQTLMEIAKNKLEKVHAPWGKCTWLCSPGSPF